MSPRLPGRVRYRVDAEMTPRRVWTSVSLGMVSRSRVLVGLWLGLAGSVLAAPPARAGDPDALIREGVELRKRGDEAGALMRFQDAYALAKTPRAAAHLGVTEQALGRWGAADRHLRQALDAVEFDPWIQKNRAALEQSLKTVGEHVGRLDVVGEPAGAEVYVDGDLIGTLPLARPVSVTTGTVVLEVRAPGHVPITRPATIAAGQLSRETFILRPTSQKIDQPAIDPPKRATADKPTVSPPIPDPPRPMPGNRPPSPDQQGTAVAGWRRPAIWGTTIAAAVALGWGVTETIMWQGKVDSFNAIEECDRPALDRGGQRCATLFEDGEGARLLAFVGYGVAGALAATSLVLYLTWPERAAGRATACAPAARGIGLACLFRF